MAWPKGVPRKKTKNKQVETEKPYDVITSGETLMYVDDLVGEINRLNRKLVIRGKLILDLPLFPYGNSVEAPNVKQFFTDRTLLYFVEGEELYQKYGKKMGCLPFSKIRQDLRNNRIQAELIK